MSNRYEHHFTDSEAVRYFKGQNLPVELREVEFCGCNETWKTPCWRVQNPHTGEWEDIRARYRDVLELALQKTINERINKVDLYTVIFKNKRDEQR